jgi:hypothetical protein
MSLNPCCEPALIESASCHVFHNHHGFCAVGYETKSVYVEEDADSEKAEPFIAIKHRMILGKAEAIARRQFGDGARRFICPPRPCAFQSRLEQTFITYSGRPTELSETFAI